MKSIKQKEQAKSYERNIILRDLLNQYEQKLENMSLEDLINEQNEWKEEQEKKEYNQSFETTMKERYDNNE